MASTALRPILEVSHLGVIGYDAATRLMEERVDVCFAGAPDALYLLEHLPVYTLGRGADPRYAEGAWASDVPVVRSGRGGQVTYHGPGQLVAYPVVDLRRHGCDVGAYVGRLEAVVIRTLETWGIAGRREPEHPGVWVGDRKIASIGIAVRRWIAWHGLALNVGPEIAPFERIVPCGIAGLRMTAVALEGGPDSVAAVAAPLARVFAAEFGHDAVESRASAPAEARP